MPDIARNGKDTRISVELAKSIRIGGGSYGDKGRGKPRARERGMCVVEDAKERIHFALADITSSQRAFRDTLACCRERLLPMLSVRRE